MFTCVVSIDIYLVPVANVTVMFLSIVQVGWFYPFTFSSEWFRRLHFHDHFKFSFATVYTKVQHGYKNTGHECPLNSSVVWCASFTPVLRSFGPYTERILNMCVQLSRALFICLFLLSLSLSAQCLQVRRWTWNVEVVCNPSTGVPRAPVASVSWWYRPTTGQAATLLHQCGVSLQYRGHMGDFPVRSPWKLPFITASNIALQLHVNETAD